MKKKLTITETKEEPCRWCKQVVKKHRYKETGGAWYSDHACPALADVAKENQLLQKKLFSSLSKRKP